jgi:membrane associated rhomboid family serine protease
MFGMFKQHLFVNLIIMLQAGAVVEYAINRKWFLTFYWLLGLLTNLVITYGFKK